MHTDIVWGSLFGNSHMEHWEGHGIL